MAPGFACYNIGPLSQTGLGMTGINSGEQLGHRVGQKITRSLWVVVTPLRVSEIARRSFWILWSIGQAPVESDDRLGTTAASEPSGASAAA